MKEAKEKKQSDFESGWAVSFNEVCSVSVTALMIKLVAQRPDVMSCLPLLSFYRKSHNRPMKMTVEFLSWRYQHAFQAKRDSLKKKKKSKTYFSSYL